MLQQNTGKQAAVINLIGTARGKQGDSIASIMKQTEVWKKLREEVSRVVRVMPLWKLQTVIRRGWI